MITFTRRGLLGAAAATASLVAGTMALASTSAYAATTATLKDSQQGAAASSYDGGSDCAGYSGADTLWHFVVPALDADPNSTTPDIVSFAGSFPGGTIDQVTVVQNGKGVYVFTTGASTVQTASVTLSADVPDSDAVLVLSHTCVGTGGSSGGSTTGGTTGTTTGSTSTGGTSTGGSSGTSTGGTSTGGSTGTSTGGSTGTSSGGSTGTSSGGATSGALSDPTTGGGSAVVVDTVPPAVPPVAAPEIPPIAAPVAVPVAGAPAPAAASGSAAGAASAAAPPAKAATGAAAAAAGNLPFTGAPVALVATYGLLALLGGVLLLVLGRRSPVATVAPVAAAPYSPVVATAVRPAPVAATPAVYRGKHARVGSTGMALLVLVSVSLLAARVSRR